MARPARRQEGITDICPSVIPVARNVPSSRVRSSCNAINAPSTPMNATTTAITRNAAVIANVRSKITSAASRNDLLLCTMMGATAGILSIPIGVLLSAVLINVINLRSFGWTIFFEPVPETYLQAFAVSVAAALLASVYPMLRLSRLQVANALREE